MIMNSHTLEGQLREMYGRAAYTHKTHEKMADQSIAKYKLVKTIEIVLSALASSSFILAVFGDTRSGTISGALLSTVLLGLLLYFKEANLGEQAPKAHSHGLQAVGRSRKAAERLGRSPPDRRWVSRCTAARRDQC